MSIHRATLKDLDVLAELMDLYRKFYNQESNIVAAKDFIEGRLKNEESVIFITFHEEKAVGFTQLFPSFSSVSLKRIWILNDLFVKVDYRGKGYGEELVNRSILFAKETDAKGVLLETNVQNEVAQRLYEKIGFTKETNHFYFYLV
ncbi:GNAT family N-acetyltransferase [Sporosarcina siberiensis]|uniref:GNAT family N-acetyltransferase n=1 Tax=Sporosarcina siberiensis TaxID=1365606 RepID=A0ABW4SDA8_9BACL